MCYLPPEDSSSNVNAQEYYDNLLAQFYRYKDIGIAYMCGDFNSRIGDLEDYIEGTDDVPPRNVTDYTKNKYGEGKRLFKMAPLHHHFELSGWDENHVVVRFWIVGILLALLSLTTFKLQ